MAAPPTNVILRCALLAETRRLDEWTTVALPPGGAEPGFRVRARPPAVARHARGPRGRDGRRARDRNRGRARVRPRLQACARRSVTGARDRSLILASHPTYR